MKLTRPAKAGRSAFGATQFVIAVLGLIAASPFILALFIVGFIWKVIDDI